MTGIVGTMLSAALIATAPLPADQGEASAEEEQRVQEEQLRERRAEMLAAIEQRRTEAERAAQQARIKAEELRVEAQRMRVEAEGMMREAGEERAEQMREMQRAREELSRTHRELRRASREVARAYRELALAEDRKIRRRMINLGDRAMIGVILGEETDEGIEIIGLSPDGPAERAGLQTGDLLVSLRGENLAESRGRSPRETVYEVMSEVDHGEEISVGVLREGERWDFMVKAEKREPASWASVIRLPKPPDAPLPPREMTVVPGAPHVQIERIAVPPVDTAALAAEAEALAEEFESYPFLMRGGDGEPMVFRFDESFDFDYEGLSDIGAMALSEATVWFGPPATHGIRFLEINEGLGQYFDADRGALVLDAPEDNPFGLEPGDVVLSVGNSEVNSTADIVRALRDYEAGEEVELAIKRNKRNESLNVVIPENRFGLIHPKPIRKLLHATEAPQVRNE